MKAGREICEHCGHPQEGHEDPDYPPGCSHIVETGHEVAPGDWVTWDCPCGRDDYEPLRAKGVAV